MAQILDASYIIVSKNLRKKLAFFKEISNLILGNSKLSMPLPKAPNVKAVTGIGG
ncbi:MAG: hypothetical protein M0R47_15525 [Methylobacter sp.]|jgi:hypothetical protein|nr:hypothetical protein [Methylobacter sp.]